ncbi:probable disease resistance protein RF9 [Pyrus x bretschneideri]|uniref:probable disease resistance protein RF9 n=1 Tax=Pyrus x bretschneideri TaxID=225117 RepID=UPI0020309C49|nr:probable disease resistance protein RF9 [Pyrus x bretschneideri]
MLHQFAAAGEVMDLNPAGDRGSKDVDKVLSTVSFAYNKERATSSSPFIDSILHNAHLFVLFAVYLICRYVNHVSLYQVLVCVGLTPLFLYFYINYAPFLFLEEDIKWIRREWRLLHAIVEDAEKIMEYRGLIGARACKIWDSNPDGATVKGVDETEVAWLEKAKSMVLQAENLVETFEEQRIRRDSHTQRLCFDMTTENFQQVTGLFTETKTVKQEMKDMVEENKVYGIDIGESLERSRSSIVSLLDRPVDGHDQQKWVKSKEQVSSAAALASTVVENIKSLTIQKPDLTCKDTGDQISSIDLQLQQLHHFLKDIEGIRFESKIEEAWVKEVHEMIKEADDAVNKYWQRIGRLSFINNWNAGRKLKGDIRCLDVGFTKLLEWKDSYGFKFVRRDSSKFVYQSPQQTEDDSIISTILRWMHKLLTDKSHLLGEVLYEVTSLYKQLEKMHKLVRDASGGGYNSRMSWLEQARKISKSAKESLITFQSNSDNMRQNLLFKTRAGRKFSRDVYRINHNIDLFLKCIRAYDIEVREEPNSVVGLEEDIEAVVSQLTTNDENPSVISIVGIGGIGKTTLAKKIYDHGVVVDHFPCRAWVSLPQKSDNGALLEDVAKQVLRSLQLLEEENRNGSWIQKAHDVLKDKRYLLVLDNISTEEEFNTLETGFPVTSTGRKILLTTRDNKVASGADISPHKLRLRTKEESWQLFTQMVHFPPTEALLAKDIFGKCGGLPQAIFHVGYLMLGKDASMAEETKMVLTDIKQNDTPLLATFTTRSINLPPHLKKCLSYLELFPNDFEIPARRLTALWIAEGLVEDCKTEETDEDVADKYLSELIHLDMIQVVKRKHNGEVKTCSLPYALQKDPLPDGSPERLIDHYSKNNASFAHIHGDSANFPSHYRDLVSIISFDTREGNKPGEEIGNFLRRGIAGGFFHRLQVLDLERVFRPELPNTIGKLKKLRYLGLRWTFLESVPASIGDLLNLQTLDVKHTDVQTLPSSIWKLQKLRHLYLNQSYQSKFMHQQGGSSLKNLRTLWGVFLDKDSPLIHWIDKLINLRKLGLAFQLSLPEQQPLADKLADKIVKLKNLQSLRIRSIDEMREPYLIRVNLSNLESLSSLNLFGKLDTSMIAEFPKNLTDLTLSGAFLSVDPMPMLEKLSNLKFLNFYSNSYTGIDMVCSTTGFPKLVVLKLWKLQNLTDWNVEEKAMQNLRELEIRACTNLKVPSGLRHLKNLTLLKLTNMPEEFSATIAITKAQIWDDIVHSPAVITDSW